VMAGAFVVRGTRVLAQAVIDNASDGTMRIRRPVG